MYAFRSKSRFTDLETSQLLYIWKTILIRQAEADDKRFRPMTITRKIGDGKNQKGWRQADAIPLTLISLRCGMAVTILLSWMQT